MPYMLCVVLTIRRTRRLIASLTIGVAVIARHEVGAFAAAIVTAVEKAAIVVLLKPCAG
jgi:hypothetical protein